MNTKQRICVAVPHHFIRYNKNSNLIAGQMQMRLFLFIFLISSFGKFGWCYTSIETLLRLCGVTTESSHLKRSSKYNDLIGELNWFIENDYIINISIDVLTSIPVNQIIKIQCKRKLKDNGFYTYGKFSVDDNFTFITAHEYLTLIENNSKSSRLKELHVYMYIKSLIYVRHGEDRIDAAPQCCTLSQKQLAQQCKLSLGTVTKTIDRLKSLDLLACEKPKNIRRKIPLEDNPQILKHLDEYINTRTVYVLKTDGYEEELKAGVNKYIKEIIDNYQIKKSA